MKPICVKCQRFYKCVKTGYYFTEGMPRTTDKVRPGKVDAEQWMAYKIWVGDVYRCDGCGSEIVSGVGARPISERHHHDFHAVIDRLNARQLQVNDA